jgi:hypothetical protein
MRYLFEGMTSDAGAFSSEKGKCWVRGHSNGYRRKQGYKSGKTVFMGMLRKELKHILEILINVKAGRIKWGARKVYPGRRVGQACLRVSRLKFI